VEQDDTPYKAITERIAPGATVVRRWPLEGGVSAQVDALEIAHPDGSHVRLVVRRHGDRDRAQNEHVALNEYRLLQILHEAGYPAPAPVFVDPDRAFFPIPVVVVGYIDGAPDLTLDTAPDSVTQMADALARLHAMALAESRVDFLPTVRDTLHRRLFASPGQREMPPDERRVREAMVRAWPQIPDRVPVLLHGDFWPGNLLWRDGTLVGVIDWEDATRGDPLFDLAAARLELYWARDGAAVRELTKRYLAQSGLGHPVDLPFWDLTAALDPILNLHTWGHPPKTEEMMRRKLVGFIDDALVRLGVMLPVPD
jgi:aminoglycoside phosphotransferase (APT) family kinase protein